VSGIAFTLSFVSARCYLRTGLANLLLLGAGVLALGLGGLGAWLKLLPDGANILVTTSNVGMLLGSVLCLGSAVMPTVKPLNTTKTKVKLTTVYAGVLVFTGLSMKLAFNGAFSWFFSEGSGHTLVSQTVLAASGILFAVSSSIVMRAHSTFKPQFLYWYSLFLASFAIGNIMFSSARFLGDPLGWAARIAQCLGSLYVFIALLSARREAKLKRLPFAEVLACHLV
jgi:hypothetical protein